MMVNGPQQAAAIVANEREMLNGSGDLLLVRLLGIVRFFGLLTALLECGAQDVAQRRARVGGAVLGDCLLLLGDFERLDRYLHLMGAAIELDHARINLLADREALGPLLAAIASKLRALDEGGELGADDVRLESAFLHLGDLAGDDRALLDIARGFAREGVALELLDAE